MPAAHISPSLMAIYSNKKTQLNGLNLSVNNLLENLLVFQSNHAQEFLINQKFLAGTMSNQNFENQLQ